MINKYSISNFKIHKEGYIFGLNGLTILTGTNNSGKSSVVQSLRLLSKINGSVSRYTRLPFEDVRELKDFKRTLNKDVSRSESIKYKFSLNIEEFKFCNIELEFESIYNFRIPFKEIIDQAILKRVDIYFENNDGLIKNYEFIISVHDANNITYDLNEINLNDENGIKLIQNEIVFRGLYPNLMPKVDFYGLKELLIITGHLGEISDTSIAYIPGLRQDMSVSMAEFLDDFKEMIIFDGKSKLKEAFNFWTNRILNTEFRVNIQDNVRRVVAIEGNIEFDLSQIGFGNTQILPILVSILTSNRGDLIIIENPEVHLHPKWKTNLVELFYYAVKHGVNILIETQSLEIVNRIRLAIKNDNKLKDKTSLYFFEKHGLISSIQKIEIERTGSLDSWPDDFIDKVTIEDNFELM